MEVVDVEGKTRSLHEKAAMLVKQQQTDAVIIRELMEEEIDEHYAMTIIDNVRQDKHKKKGIPEAYADGLIHNRRRTAGQFPVVEIRGREWRKPILYCLGC